jgi:hypothetical protein
MVEDDVIRFQFDETHRVLLVTAGERLNRRIYLSICSVIERIVAERGPCSSILDLTRVVDFDVSAELAREIAAMQPAIPPGWARVVVAPQPLIYGTARIVETLRSVTPTPIKVVRTLDEALASFATGQSHFEPID